jgi:hypothetical protein
VTTIAAWGDPAYGVVMAYDDAILDAGLVDQDARKVSVFPVATDSELEEEQAALGAAGRFALVQVARYKLSMFPCPRSASVAMLDQWAFDISVELTALAKAASIVDKDGDVDGYWLLGFRGHVWELGQHLAWRPAAYTAIGSGRYFAVGALDALLADTADPLAAAAAVRRSVEIACARDTGSSGPVHVEELRHTR